VTRQWAFFAWKNQLSIPSQLCHLDRSAAQWRDLRFPLPVLTQL
jgi:hypothetical protein